MGLGLDQRLRILWVGILTVVGATLAPASVFASDPAGLESEFELRARVFLQPFTPQNLEARKDAEAWLLSQLEDPAPLRRLHAVLALRYVPGLAHRVELLSALQLHMQRDSEVLVRWGAAALLAVQGLAPEQARRALREGSRAIRELRRVPSVRWGSELSPELFALSRSEFIPLLRSELVRYLDVFAHWDLLKISRRIVSAQGWRTIAGEWDGASVGQPRCPELFSRAAVPEGTSRRRR